MTAAVEIADRSVGAARSRGRRGVVALARVEAGLLARHPLVAAGLLFSALLLYQLYDGLLPYLPRDDAGVTQGLLPLTAGAFLAANSTTLRSRRHGTEELYTSTAVTPTTRVAAHLLSVLTAVGLASGVVLCWLAAALAVGATGLPDAAELITGPIMVGFGGALGVAVAMWVPNPRLAPLFLLALALFQAWPGLVHVSGGLTALVPLTPYLTKGWGAFEPISDFRPAAEHLLYLGGLAGLAVAAALGRRYRSSALALAVLTALVVTVTGASLQAVPPSRAAVHQALSLSLEPAAHQRCEHRESVRYCYYPGFAGYVDQWAPAVSPVLEATPQPRTDLVVRQRTSPVQVDGVAEAASDRAQHAFWSEPSGDAATAEVGVTWGVGTKRTAFELALGLEVAKLSTGIPRGAHNYHVTRDDVRAYRTLYGEESPRNGGGDLALRAGEVINGQCIPADQARAVVALWLAGQASSGNAAALRSAVDGPLYGQSVPSDNDDEAVIHDPIAKAYLDRNTLELPLAPGFVGESRFTRLDGAYALKLLEHPRDEVLPVLHANWERWLNPSTSSGELARALGLPVHPPPEQVLNQAGIAAFVVQHAVEEADLARISPYAVYNLPRCR